jgi:hypothetical protein
MLLFRAMKEASDGKPLVADTTSGLGVRDYEIDIEDGMVQPETGGMSVSPETVYNLPPSFRPVEFGGTNKGRHAWTLREDDLGEDLTARPDAENPKTHSFIEPVRPMTLEQYKQALWETRDSWRKYE